MNKIYKNLVTLILSIILICSAGIVKADTSTGALALAAETSQHPGDTFTVAVNFSNLQTDEKASFGINGKIEYDKEKLDFVSIASNTDGGWDAVGPNTFNQSNMSYWFENTFGKGDIGANSNIFTLTFKVKDGVTGDAIIKVNVSEVSHNSNFPGASITINITEKTQDNPAVDDPSVDNPPVDDPAVDDPSVDNPTVDNPTKDPSAEEPPKTGDENGNGSEGTETDKKPTAGQSSEQKNDGGKNDKTTSSGSLPKTGENNIVLVGIAICGIAAIVTFCIYRKETYKKND